MPRKILLLFLVCGLLACRRETTPPTITADALPAGTLTARSPFDADAPAPTDPLLRARFDQIQATIKQEVPVLMLTGLDEMRQTAQTLALADDRLRRNLRDTQTQAPLFHEVFGVVPMRESDFVGPSAACRQGFCYRVEIYDFARNATLNAVIETNSKQVLTVTRAAATQPDLPPHLVALATHIATAAPEVKDALGFTPDAQQALMANTKTALNRTRCERSQHLCVAPTFVKDDRALWAIVDLTDLALVGTRWTQVGRTGPPVVTEKWLQNDVLTNVFCARANHLERNGWAMDYILTSSDGLRLSQVTFQKRPVINSVKLVDWHVSYSGTDGFGYSDAVGCPVFSQAAVVAVNGPKFDAITRNGQEIGFTVRQDFWSEGWPTPCNYSYQQIYEFYNDGRFRVAVASVGRGCGNDGTYRPVTRIALAGERNSFAEWRGNDWQKWDTERWAEQKSDTPYTKEGFQYRVTSDEGKGYFLEPGRGQFNDGGRGDNAFLYVTRGHADRDEGESDLTTLGPCCNTDYRQGPEKFIEPQPETIDSAGLVVWYVAQLKNDDTPGKQYCWAESVPEKGVYGVKKYPCIAGPMFHPFGGQ